MTRRSQAYLGALLAAQVVLAIVTWSSGGVRLQGGAKAHRLLADVEAGDIVQLTLIGEPEDAGRAEPAAESAAEPERLVLARRGEGWVVASAGDYPAKSERVDDLVDKLLAATVREPIATQAVSHDALDVGERDYARRVIIETAAGARTLVLGNGPRSSAHVRFEGEDDVYSVRGLSVWNVRTDARSYIDPLYVDVDRQKLTAVTVRNARGTLTFVNGSDGWDLAELPAGGERDAGKIGALINAVSRLNVQEPVGTGVEPDYGLSNGARVTLAWNEDDRTETLSYVVGAAADDRSYYAKADGNDYVVTILKYAAEQVLTKTPADFVKAAPADSNTAPADSAN